MPVTPHTLFQAGSISKPVAAAALALAECGKLALDDDVHQKLRSWKVPDNASPRSRRSGRDSAVALAPALAPGAPR